MKRISLILFGTFLFLSACTTGSRMSVAGFTEEINLVKSLYPNLYEKYMNGEIRINGVYVNPQYPGRYMVDYTYIRFEEDTTRQRR